jgi:hypothetical protein
LQNVQNHTGAAELVETGIGLSPDSCPLKLPDSALSENTFALGKIGERCRKIGRQISMTDCEAAKEVNFWQMKSADRNIMGYIFLTAVLVLFSITGIVSASEDDIFEIVTEGSYRIEDGTSIDLAKKMALFTAKKKAVDLAGRYLSRKSLIEVYELDKDEIYSLAAREIQVEILEEKGEKAGKIATYRVRIKARVQASNFVKAEMEDTRQEKKEDNESYREEMEQRLSSDIDPGKDIAKAYRLLREKKWRIAGIYLNHLEKKYPNWDSVYMAKAVTCFILHEPAFMKKALTKACGLGNQTACDDLSYIKRVNEHDFDLSIID